MKPPSPDESEIPDPKPPAAGKAKKRAAAGKARSPSAPVDTDGMVVILDDDPMILNGLDRLLSSHGYEVITYSESPDLLAFEPPPRPCCVILDNELNGPASGLEVYAEIQRRQWKVVTIFLTAHWDVSLIVEAVRNGAQDFLTKPFDPAALLEKVANAIESARERLKETAQADEIHRRVDQLTPRELEIVRHVASGLLNKEIADLLDLAVVTVKVHRGRAMAKLGAGNAAELARLAQRAGILD